jgi:predicted nucleic acid-binding protein
MQRYYDDPKQPQHFSSKDNKNSRIISSSDFREKLRPAIFSRFIPLACKETANELTRVPAYPKFQLTEDEIKKLSGEIFPFPETRELEENYTAIEGLRDDSDAVFIHPARQIKADFLVSGDADILAFIFIITH